MGRLIAVGTYGGESEESQEAVLSFSNPVYNRATNWEGRVNHTCFSDTCVRIPPIDLCQAASNPGQIWYEKRRGWIIQDLIG